MWLNVCAIFIPQIQTSEWKVPAGHQPQISKCGTAMNLEIIREKKKKEEEREIRAESVHW